MLIVILFVIANALVSIYLEKKKMFAATVLHASTFAIALVICLLVNINPQIVYLFKNLNASKEFIELILLFADKSSAQISEIGYLIELVTWVLVIAIIACQTVIIIQKIKFNLSIRFSNYTFHQQNERKTTFNVYDAPIRKLMVMRC